MERKDYLVVGGLLVLISLNILILSLVSNDSNSITGEAVGDSDTPATEAVLVLEGGEDNGLVKCCELPSSDKSCYAAQASDCNSCTDICG